MKTARLIFSLLLLALAGGSAFALQPVPWNHKDFAVEFKYFREGKLPTPEAWAALPPEEQERLLSEARQPSLERLEAINAYYAAAMAKWNSPTLRDYAAKTTEADVKAVQLWLGKEKAADLARKLVLTRALLKKAAATGLTEADELSLEPHLLPAAIADLRALKFSGEALKRQAAGATAKGPSSQSTASLDKFAGPDPSKLGGDSFSKLYDNMSASGGAPVVAARGQAGAGAARPLPAAVITAPQPKKPAFAMPEVKSAPETKSVPPEKIKSTSLTSDAYGYTVTANGRTQTYRDAKEAEAAIRQLPAGSVSKIILYGHGSPGMQTVGPQSYDSDSAAELLKGKMAKGGVIEFSGCNTASIGGSTLNPAVGLSMVARRLLYFSLPYFQDRADGVSAEQAKQQWEKGWNADLARDTSLGVKGAIVCGYRTFGLVPGRLPGLTRVMGNQEETTPGYIAGKKACYQDGREVPAQ